MSSKLPSVSASESSSVSGRTYILLVLAAVIAVSILRDPRFVLEPRLWAEEGTVYLHAAIQSEDLSDLLRPHLGYYSLIPNLMTHAGLTMSGLSGVAVWTTWSSFVLMIACVTAPLFLPGRFWDTRMKRTAIILFALVAGSAEIWLNTINIQHYLCVFTGFLFLSDITKASRRIRAYAMIMTAVAAFTGVPSMLLLPAVVIRMRTSSRHDRLWMLTLGLFGLAAGMHVLGLWTTAS
ncbi:MAG: hypothetical protein ACKOAG_11875, partial [Candidatus Kapaibacterium sp.]